MKSTREFISRHAVSDGELECLLSRILAKGTAIPHVLGHVDPNPEPGFFERLGGAYRTSPDYTKWANGHNDANRQDRTEVGNYVTAAQTTGKHEAQVEHDAAAGKPEAVKALHAIENREEALNKHLPPGALPMGTRLDTGTGPASPIRDINVIESEHVRWGFVYRTADGSVFVQRDAASVAGKSTTDTYGGSATVGVSVSGEVVGGNGSVGGNYSHGTTITDPALQPVYKLTNADHQLPADALISPIGDSMGRPYSGSQQLLPTRPHGHENAYDHAKPPPLDKFDVVTPMYGALEPGKSHVEVAMNRDGQAGMTVDGPEQSRSHAFERA